MLCRLPVTIVKVLEYPVVGTVGVPSELNGSGGLTPVAHRLQPLVSLYTRVHGGVRNEKIAVRRCAAVIPREESSHSWLQPETSTISSHNVHIMSTKPNPNTNPNPVDVACAIVDVAPAAANTIWKNPQPTVSAVRRVKITIGTDCFPNSFFIGFKSFFKDSTCPLSEHSH